MGLLLVSAAGFPIVGAVVYRLAAALRLARARAEEADVRIGLMHDDGSRVVMVKDVAKRAALVAETQAAREAFARSAEVIGEYLYSGERMPDEGFVMHAHGPGLAALLGAAEETEQLVDGLRRVRPSRRSRPNSTSPGASPT